MEEAVGPKITTCFKRDWNTASLTWDDPNEEFTSPSGTIMKYLGEAGQKNLEAYIRNGGRYLGICAGSHLALEDELALSGYKSVGRAQLDDPVEISLNEDGKRELGLEKEIWNVRYTSGPLITNGLDVTGADVRVWGTYANTDLLSESGKHFLLVLHISLCRLHEHRYHVVPLLELHVNTRKGVLHHVALSHEAIIH